MGTLAIVVILLAVAGGVTYFIKTGKIKDENNNNIPDVVEDKIEEIKEQTKVVKAKAKKLTDDVTKAVKVVEKTAKKVVVEAEKISAKPKTKKTTTGSVKKTSAKK
jgi:hypothetical protein